MLEQLAPTVVWKYFEEFCNIPHPSGFEQKAAQYILKCAENLNLPAITDSVGNILVRKKATSASYTAGVILQAHLDMVPQKNESTTHDFKKDPIKPRIENDWVKAQGTTLGADNGIGVAVALGLLARNDISHGPLEALFTLDEERGMTGAFGLSPDLLNGTMLINLDTEEELEICIGCAGGTDIKSSLKIQREPCPHDTFYLSLSLSGLQGGHSGMEIHLDRANALKIMGHFLKELSAAVSLSIVDLNGGSARNAIPREAFCTIAVTGSASESLVLQQVNTLNQSLKKRFHTTDPDLLFTCQPTTVSTAVLSEKNTQDIINILNDIPNGVISMSTVLEKTVQTSNNLAVVKTESDNVRIDSMLRSSVESDLRDFKNKISDILTQHNAEVSYSSMYPGWQPKTSSLLTTIKSAYTNVHGREPSVVAVHAGLECGIIGSKYPHLEMVSCGPTIRFAHSPDEQMSISSVERFWQCIVTGLEMLH